MDHWKMFSIGNHVMGLIEETADNGDIKRFKIAGEMRGRWLVATITSASADGHGTLYLHKGSNGRFEGFQITDDCHSKVDGAAVMCPYVLEKTKEDKGLLSAASLQANECQPLHSIEGLPAVKMMASGG